jgi:PIN domain
MMPTKTYVVLDTNILFRYITQGIPGCEEKAWDKLNAMVRRSKVTVLIPEVTALEVQKLIRVLETDISSAVATVKASIEKMFDGKSPIWNEVHDSKGALVAKLEEFKAEKLRASLRRQVVVQYWLESRSHIKLPLDSDIHLRTKKRLMSGNHPSGGSKDSKSRDNDLMIIDSLVQYFQKLRSKDQRRLLVCTQNLSDFSLDLPGEDENNVHPTLKDGLPEQTRILQSLTELVEFAERDEPVKAPKPEEVTEALAKEQDLGELRSAFVQIVRQGILELAAAGPATGGVFRIDWRWLDARLTQRELSLMPTGGVERDLGYMWVREPDSDVVRVTHFGGTVTSDVLNAARAYRAWKEETLGR